MIQRRQLKKLIIFLSVSGLSMNSYAGAFQLWGLDAASIGNDHADRAVMINDASTAYYNPAGLVKMKNQQFVGGVAPTMTDIRFHGTEAVNTLTNPAAQPATAQGGSFKLYPFAHYAAPISDYFVFGLSVVEPFGFKTDYGNTSPLRYSSTLDTLDVYDISPSLGILFTDKFSMGFGIDFERLSGEFDSTITTLGQGNDTGSTNSGNDWGYGYHIGALYQFTPKTRIGVTYQSQAVHRLSGTSTFTGPLAGGIQTSVLKMKIMLPPTTTLSAFHSFNSQWDAMGSVSYTQWTVTNSILMNNVTGVQGGVVVNTIQTPLVQGYRNSWNWSVGTNYHFNERVMLRAGLGYDETPTSNNYRNVQIPDANRIAVALGSHFQATNTLGFDVGWTHLFAVNNRINNYAQAAGDQVATTSGSVQQNTDVYGIQVKWDIV